MVVLCGVSVCVVKERERENRERERYGEDGKQVPAVPDLCLVITHSSPQRTFQCCESSPGF